MNRAAVTLACFATLALLAGAAAVPLAAQPPVRGRPVAVPTSSVAPWNDLGSFVVRAITPFDASGPYSAEPGPTSTSMPARSTFGVTVNEPSGNPLSGMTEMRPSSVISIRLLNDELKPRALMAIAVMPT